MKPREWRIPKFSTKSILTAIAQLIVLVALLLGSAWVAEGTNAPAVITTDEPNPLGLPPCPTTVSCAAMGTGPMVVPCGFAPTNLTSCMLPDGQNFSCTAGTTVEVITCSCRYGSRGSRLACQ